jgi:hypothetical protein
MAVMKQTFAFTFTGWDALIEWHKGHEWSSSRVHWSTTDADLWYLLQYAGSKFSVVGVSCIGNGGDGPGTILGRWVDREEIDRYRSDRFNPTQAGELVEATDTDVVDWAATLAKVKLLHPAEVVVVRREVREGLEPDEVHLQRIGGLTFDAIGGRGPGLLLGEDGALELITGPDHVSEARRDMYGQVRDELLRLATLATLADLAAPVDSDVAPRI